MDKHNEEIETLREQVAELRAEKRLSEIREMAKSVKFGDQDEIVETLKNVDEAGGDVEGVLALMKSASTVVEQALGEEIGSTAPGQLDEGYEAIKAEAQRVATEEGISYYKALDRVRKSNRELITKNASQ